VFLGQNKVTIIALLFALIYLFVMHKKPLTNIKQVSYLQLLSITRLLHFRYRSLGEVRKKTFLWDVTPCFSLGNKEKVQHIIFRPVIRCGL